MRIPDAEVRDGGAAGAVGPSTKAEILLDGAAKAPINSMNLALHSMGSDMSTTTGSIHETILMERKWSIYE
jgi:hypothetical protein